MASKECKVKDRTKTVKSIQRVSLMSSDVKIGLLLGLAFIFIIAFVINGLPSSHPDRNNNELTTNMVDSQNSPPAIAARERKLTGRVQLQPRRNEDIRFERALPKSASVVKVARPKVLSAVERQDVRKVEPVKPALPRFYIVGEGDSLWRIAAEQLGDGNRYGEIARLNADILDDEDSLSIGMRLKLPVR